MDDNYYENVNSSECGCEGCAACSTAPPFATDINDAHAGSATWLSYLPRAKTIRLAIGMFVFVLALLWGKDFAYRLYLLMPAYLILGYDVIFRALKWKGKQTFFDEHFLMTAATIGAFAIGEYPEAVAVMLFYQSGELLQGIAVGHSRRSIQALQAIRPDRANLVTDSGLSIVDPEEVAEGATIVIRPGERVPLDSIILDGETELDTAALTGESLPRPAGPEDEILAGSVNGSGKITAQVLRPAASSAVSRIMHLVEEAAARKAPAEKFISRFAAVYTPVMLGLALIIAFAIPSLFSLDYSEWIYRALIVLVVSCPCALVISVPLGYFAGLGVLARKGTLLKGGTFIEQLARTKKIAFDKTGTLTEGDFTVEKIEPYMGSEEDLLELATAAENHSNHPLAVSLRRYYQQQTGKTIDTSQIESYREYPGKGVFVQFNGQRILAGNLKLMQDNSIQVPITYGESANEEGAVLHMAVAGIYWGRITLTDSLKPGINKTIKSLQDMGIELLLLSGDRREAVDKVSQSLNLGHSRSALLPEEKVSAFEDWMADSFSSGTTLYVGDGINDAPVLARADVGIAMGNGSDAATENADGVLISGDISSLPQAIRLAKKTTGIIRQNVVLAIGFKALILGLATLGLGSIWQAVFADVGVTILAVLNSVRLLAGSKKESGEKRA